MKRSHLSISSFKLIMLIIGLFPPMLVGAQCFSTQNFSSNYSAFTVPSDAPQYTIRITVIGADGGNYTSTPGQGGSGAEMIADFTVDGGDRLDVYVGKSGKAGAHIRAGGGGGSSAVVLNESNVLIVAAGGGGSGGGTIHPDDGEGGRATVVSGAGGGSSFTGYAASGGGFGLQSAGDDGFGGSTGGEPGLYTGFGRGGDGGLNGGNGGNGFGAGGGAAAQVGGGGGGYKGGNGGVRPNYGGKGGKSFTTGGFSRELVLNNDGVEGGAVVVGFFQDTDDTSRPITRNGSVKIECLSFVVLPVELISFKGKREGSYIKLDWQTESELNNKGFEIERTIDGISWEHIGFVEGNGTTTENIDYEFIDTEPANGINYYRLKQLDFDGVFEYSTVISVIMSDENKVSLFPNPTSGRVLVSGLTLDNASLEIADNLGKMIRKETLNDQHIDISDLPNGIYFLTIKTADQTLLKRIIKED